MNKLKKYFLTGFAVVIPFFLTLYVLIGAFQLVDGILGRLLNFYFKKALGFYIPGLGFLLFLFLMLFVGFLASRFVGKRIFPGLEKWFSKIPVINNIYPTVKQTILFISAQHELGFKKVVLVQYPSSGIWSLGFVTNDQFQEVNRLCEKDMVSVFLPSSPNPLTGYVVFVPRGDIRFPGICVKEALKIIISGGVFKDYEKKDYQN